MTEYHFRLILSGPFSGQVSDEELLDATAIHDVERAGYVVQSIQMDRDAVLPAGSN